MRRRERDLCQVRVTHLCQRIGIGVRTYVNLVEAIYVNLVSLIYVNLVSLPSEVPYASTQVRYPISNLKVLSTNQLDRRGTYRWGSQPTTRRR